MLSRKISHSTPIIVLTLIWISVLIFYMPPYFHSFVGDDYVQLDYVSDFLQRPFTAYQVFNPFRLLWYYRPLQNLWFLANRLVFGLNPFGYYYLQICLHLLAVALVYRVARQMGIGTVASLAGAAFFAVRNHHTDVITWISSIAIVLAAVFALLALSSYLSYLRRPARWPLLLLATVFFLLGMLSHEEAFLLPPLLLFWRLGLGDWRLDPSTSLRATIRNWRLKERQEMTAFLFMFLTMAAYLPFQLMRENAVIDLSGTPAQQWLDYLAPDRLGRFVVEVLARTIPFATIEVDVVLLALLVLVPLALWFWRGDRVVRLGLAWTVLHLAFIYWVLWTQKPEFFAGRHIYNAWIGFTLALSAGIDWFLNQSKRLEIGDCPSPISNLQFRQILVGVVVTAVLLIHGYLVRQFQADWLTMTQEQAKAARQMKELLPSVTDVHLFAYRFAIKPDFLPSFAEVWYGATPPQPAGSFNQLQRYGRATDNFYLLDYEDGRVYNLMPELQAHEQTLFLWSQTPRVEIVGPGDTTISGEPAASFDLTIVSSRGERRLALPVQPPQSQGGSLSLAYVVTVPEQSQLRFSLYSTGHMAFRVRLLPASGQAETLYETVLESNDRGWTDVVIPMAAYGGQPVALRLETAGDSSAWGYWANPRFVIGD